MHMTVDADFTGRVALVTGASRGLGKDIALALAGTGASVAAAARTETAEDSRIPGSLADTVALIEDTGAAGLAVHCDVTDPEQVAAAVQATVDAFGRLDIVVNNAGILIPGAVTELQPRHWELIFRVNVHGPFNVCRAAIPHLAAARDNSSGGGHIINISSRAAIGPGPGPYEDGRPSGGAAYGATKAALERFSQGLAVEVARDGISVNALSPHLPIWSEGGHYFRSGSGDPDYAGWRLSGEIIGDAAVTIAAQPAGTYTGHILYDERVMLDEGGLTPEQVADRYPVEG
jgi:citronellol/citronellal dehydrogenase